MQPPAYEEIAPSEQKAAAGKVTDWNYQCYNPLQNHFFKTLKPSI